MRPRPSPPDEVTGPGAGACPTGERAPLGQAGRGRRCRTLPPVFTGPAMRSRWRGRSARGWQGRGAAGSSDLYPCHGFSLRRLTAARPAPAPGAPCVSDCPAPLPSRRHRERSLQGAKVVPALSTGFWSSTPSVAELGFGLPPRGKDRVLLSAGGPRSPRGRTQLSAVHAGVKKHLPGAGRAREGARRRRWQGMSRAQQLRCDSCYRCCDRSLKKGDAAALQMLGGWRCGAEHERA